MLSTFTVVTGMILGVVSDNAGCVWAKQDMLHNTSTINIQAFRIAATDDIGKKFLVKGMMTMHAKIPARLYANTTS
jgi:hypothetical protein